MAYPDTISLDIDGGTNSRSFSKQDSGRYIADDSSLGAPHNLLINHTVLRPSGGSIDQHFFSILRTEEDASDNVARTEAKLTVNVPQKVITAAQLSEVRYELIDFLSNSTYWDSFLKSEK